MNQLIEKPNNIYANIKSYLIKTIERLYLSAFEHKRLLIIINGMKIIIVN